MTPDHGELLYEGKAKRVFASTDPDRVLVEFKNDATAFNAQKKAQLDDKGRLNCQISARLFELLEREGVPTHYCGLAGETWMLVRRVEIIPLEVVLRNIAEFAGMTRHCDFHEQGADSSGQRPDMVVRVPDGGEIPVDAKFPLAAYDRANETDDPEERARQLAQHARDLKAHVNELARRDYSEFTKGDVDFTVLFLPGDHLLAAAFDADADLQTMAFEKRVLITTPVTFVALLRTVGLYWRQHQLAENAQEIATEAKELMGRLGKFIEHFSKVGKGLSQALGAYNSAVGSYERRILPSGRRVAELQALPAELPDINAIEGEVRPVEIPAPDPASDAEPGATSEDGGLLPLP